MLHKLTIILMIGFVLLPSAGFIDYGLISLFLATIINVPNVKKIDFGPVIFIFLILALIFCLACLSSLVNGGVIDLVYISKPIRYTLIVFLLYILFGSNKLSLFDSITIILWCGLLNLIAVLLQYVGANVFGFDVLTFQTNIRTTTYRMPGLATGYPSSSMLLATSTIMFILKYRLEGGKSKILGAVGLVFGQLLVSRTGLVLNACIFIVEYLRASIRNKVMLMGFSCLVVWLFLAYEPDAMYVARTLELMFEFFYQGEITSASSLVQYHFKLPTDLLTLIFGNMIPAWDPGGSNSDVFWTRFIYAVGLPSLCLYFALFVYISWIAYRGCGRICEQPENVKAYRYALLMVAFFLLLGSAKGSYIFSRFAFDAFILFALACAFASHRLREQRKSTV